MAITEVLHRPEERRRAIVRRPAIRTLIDKPPIAGGDFEKRVCIFWQQGRCTKGAGCAFVHGEAGSVKNPQERPSRKRIIADPSGARPVLKRNTWTKDDVGKNAEADDFDERPITIKNNVRVPDRLLVHKKTPEALSPAEAGVVTGPGKSLSQIPCKFWLDGSCRYGEKCKFLHASSTVSDLNLITTLKEHEKSITGIALVPDSAVLFTGSSDETLKAWDCNSGKLSDTLGLEGSVKSVTSVFGWIFVAVGDQVLGWNVKSSQQTLQAQAPAEISVLAAAKGVIVAGLCTGQVCAWTLSDELKSTGIWSGHSSAVTALTIAAGRVYSGCTHGRISVFDVSTSGGSCLLSLKAHLGKVTGLLCWESFLLSCSLDGSIKVWAATKTGGLENYFTFPEGEESFGRNEATGMCGTVDAEGKPTLACSYRDASVKFYGLPSFDEKGCLFSKAEVTSLLSAADSEFVFSGDNEGVVKVWRWKRKAMQM